MQEWFDRNNDADNAFLRMSSAILYTEQGRAKRMLTATPNQVTDDYARRITEIIHGRFDLEGLVPDNTFIEPKFEFTNPAMEAIQEEAWKIAIGGYVEQRFQETAESIERNKGRLEKDREPSYVLDDLAKTITCSEIIAYLNNGARPGAKKTGDRKMTGVRAIENDKRRVRSRSNPLIFS